MREAVVEIARVDGRLATCLLRSEVQYPEQSEFKPFKLDVQAMPKLDSLANVEAYGDRIWKELCEHPAIKSELAQISLTAAPDKAMLHFLIRPSEGECFRWEALCAAPPAQFLALNGVCTVGRIAHSGSVREPDICAFSFPLKMAALLSPAGISAKLEFDAICKRIGNARAAGLDIECTIYLGQQELIDSAQAEIDAKRLPGVTVAAIPVDPMAVEAELKKSSPQILHFFCHGALGAGVRLLELATINDWDTGKKSGSVRFSLERLNTLLLTTKMNWITVLNSCSGAQAVDQLHSMALTLAKGGTPFAVGMAEPIDPKDATDFAKAFYGELFKVIQAGVGQLGHGQQAVLDLASTVVPARDALHNKYKSAPPDAFGRWCLPLAYKRDAPLKVVADFALKRRIELVAGALRALPPDTPDQVRLAILATLDKEPSVPQHLRPDRYGNAIGVA